MYLYAIIWISLKSNRKWTVQQVWGLDKNEDEEVVSPQHHLISVEPTSGCGPENEWMYIIYYRHHKEIMSLLLLCWWFGVRRNNQNRWLTYICRSRRCVIYNLTLRLVAQLSCWRNDKQYRNGLFVVLSGHFYNHWDHALRISGSRGITGKSKVVD